MPGLVGNDEITSSSEYKALDSFVSGQLQDIETAANAFCEPVEAQAKASEDTQKLESLLWRAWGSTTALAAKTARDSDGRQRLVDLVVDIQQRQDVGSKVWDQTVWRDLPIFGPQLRESWNDAPTDSSSQEDQSAWLNLNAFTATLAKSSQDADRALLGLWNIRTALEDRSMKADGVAVSAAALWFVHAADLLHDLSRQGFTFEGKLAKPGPRFGDQEWRGFTEDRWQIWKQRLDEVREHGLEGDAEGLVKRAVDAIDSLRVCS